VTKVGFMVMIQKQSTSRRCGRAHSHQVQKMCGRSRVQQSMLIVFFGVSGIKFYSSWYVTLVIVNKVFRTLSSVNDRR
jgi:hypothetical protein